MSRDFTPRDFEDFREEVSAISGRTLDGEARQPQLNQMPSKGFEAERVRDTSLDPRAKEARHHDRCVVLYDRDRGYRVRESEVYTLTELGKFRIIGAEDLSRYVYQGRRKELQQGIRNLARQDLILQGTFRGPEASPRELLTLTKTGYRLLHANRLLPKGQAAYYGFARPKDANHDADLYRMYQKEATRIFNQGGKNLRVLLDFELMKRLNRDFSKFGIESRPEIAAWHGLEVVRGKIVLPDLRIEYETHEGELARVDLELVTEHYNSCQLTEKVCAGFSLYASSGGADRVRRVLDQRELAAAILSL